MYYVLHTEAKMVMQQFTVTTTLSKYKTKYKTRKNTCNNSNNTVGIYTTDT